MKLFMKSFEIKFRYWGDMVKADVFEEVDKSGIVYPIKLNGDYFFTLRYNKENKWTIVKERNGITRQIDKELLNRILKPLEQELKYAA